MTGRRIRDLVKQSGVTALSVANAYPVVATRGTTLSLLSVDCTRG